MPADQSVKLLSAHNAARVQAGLPPLRLNPQLQEAALAHCNFMATNGRLSHTGSGRSAFYQRIRRSGYHYSQCAENIAMGYPDVKSVMAGWLDSGPHRTNILGPYRDLGAAGIQDKNGTWWCVDFGVSQAREKPKLPAGVEILPKCALCDRQAWRQVTDTRREPFISAWLCTNHSPNGAEYYTTASLDTVRQRVEEPD